MGAIDYYPTRTGYRLTEKGEEVYRNWQDDYHRRGGCTCWRSAPCSICYHEGHPYSIEETDEYWVKEENGEMSRHNIVDKSKESVVNYKSGDKVKIIGNSNFHSYSIGDIVTLRERVLNPTKEYFYWETNEDYKSGNVRECDIEPYDSPCTVAYVKPRIEQNNNYVVDLEYFDFAINKLNKTKGDLNMSNTQRRVVNVVLIDPDQGLPVEHSQVHDFGQIVTEDDDATTIQELIMTGDVQAKLDIHNKVRSEQIDLDILRRTGNEVKLQPVKLKNLKWIIK